MIPDIRVGYKWVCGSPCQCYSIIWILATPILSVRLSLSNVTYDIEDFNIVCSFDIDVLHLRYRISISKVFDIKGLKVRYRRSPTFESRLRCRTSITASPISRLHDSDIEQTHLNIVCRHRILYRRSHWRSISKVMSYKWGRYRIRYSTQPISFTAEQKLPLPRLYHSCAEESQRHVSWIPAESCTLFLRNSTAYSTEIWRGKVLP